MTRYSNSIYIKALILMLALALGPRFVNAQTEGTVLLLQQSPPNGGAISPAVGVHSFDQNTDVTLTATPKPGYQFVYWLGDVSDATASTTTAYLDTPKIIIAVFERVKYDFALFEELPPSHAGGGGGGQRRSAPDYQGQGGFGGPGGKRPHKYRGPSYPPYEPPDDDQDDFPVPNDIDDFPVPDPEPIPEPATGLLLTLGALLARSKRKRKNNGIS